MDPAGWEVLVVDNHSTDETRAVVEAFCHRCPGQFRYLFEPRPGKSYALNAGIQAARGQLLAFIDDDVVVEPEWLHNLTTALENTPCAGVGGRILPPATVAFPGWLALQGPYSLAGALALFDPGPQAAQLTVAPFGANMAFRRAVFEKYGGFRTDLGPPPSPTRGEDTEFCQRLLAAGESLRYQPSAVVRHAVPGDCLEQRYFLAWWFGHGRALIRLKGRRPPVWIIPRHWLSIPKGLACMLQKAGQWSVARDPQRRFFLKAMVWSSAGQIAELYRQARPEADATAQAANQAPTGG
jgi:glycosyltransferase involved in cell wall biosynthesis